MQHTEQKPNLFVQNPNLFEEINRTIRERVKYHYWYIKGRDEANEIAKDAIKRATKEATEETYNKCACELVKLCNELHQNITNNTVDINEFYEKLHSTAEGLVSFEQIDCFCELCFHHRHGCGGAEFCFYCEKLEKNTEEESSESED